MARKPNKTVNFITDNLKFVILGVILLLLFRQRIVMIVTMVALAFAGHTTIKASRMFPHISLETVTPSSILIGYIWGWPIGLAFGIIVGFTGFVRASQITLPVIICSLLMGFVGVLGALFRSMGLTFVVSYLLAYVIRSITSYTLMNLTGQSPIENVLHSFVESGYNMVIIIHFMTLIYNILQPLL